MKESEVVVMLAEAIDQNREYKSWHCSTQHLMALVERVVTEEREECAKLCDALAVHPEYASEVTKLAALAIRARK
jgi:hypothetical protein